MRRASVAAVLLMALVAGSGLASGPRWRSTRASSYNWSLGMYMYNPMTWYTQQPMYFTDPGDLSSSVNHQTADAMVAAAAGVWNVPTSLMVPTYGGLLTEHVSGANTYMDTGGLVFPADVQSSNYGAKQIAVIYDNDGSVTDLLLGSGASDPGECAQNGVTGSVDAMDDRNILHAVLVLNGRCTGSEPEKQLQMTYELVRAFGRIFGVGWSQNNDNVFTGYSSPTRNQAMNWPIMHPIDITCGPYSYQCLPQPFMLRPDDVASISSMYGNAFNSGAPGKVPYLTRASGVIGTLTFPTGQGMEGVNLVVRRTQFGWSIPEDFTVISAITGFQFPQATSNPVTGGGAGASIAGWADPPLEGYYDLSMIPVRDGEETDMLTVTTEAVNPLYTGTYSIGANGATVVEPSGSPRTVPTPYWGGSLGFMTLSIAAKDAAPSCDTAADGTENAPAGMDSTGWWSGLICGYGHAGWSSMTMAAGRSLTVEVTALDESGSPTTAKAMPVIGIWDAAAATGAGPAMQTGIAATSSPFNSMSTGMTNLALSTDQPLGLRMAIADERGAGRPDFAYKARVLYADAITPANVSASGAVVTIAGMGFRVGNAVFVNGVAARVMSWSATSIVAAVPAMAAAHGSATLPVDVMVKDLSTGATTVMTSALLYGQPAAANVMQILSAPSGSVLVDNVAATPFAVKVLTGDSGSPVVGEVVTFMASPGVLFGACGAGPCRVVTDAQGVASTTVLSQVAGVVILKAADGVTAQTASFMAVANVCAISAVQPAAYLAEGVTVSWSSGVTALKNGVQAGGQAVTWTASGSGVGATSGIRLSSAQSVTDGTGWAEVDAVLGPMTGGQRATISACAWGTVCAAVQVFGVAAADLRPLVASGPGQIVAAEDTLGLVTLEVTDLAGDAVMGAGVQVFQTVSAWQMACPPRGRCPVAPVLLSSQTTAVSDGAGQVTVTPLQISGTAAVTNIAAGVGTQGFLTLSLVKAP